MIRSLRRLGLVAGCSLVMVVAVVFGTPSAYAAAGSNPTVSPAAHDVWTQQGWETAPQEVAQCKTGYACLRVQVKGLTGYRVFDFYYYGTYYLSDWLEVGSIVNNQTGGALVRVTKLNGDHWDYKHDEGVDQLDWSPIWKVTLLAG